MFPADRIKNGMRNVTFMLKLKKSIDRLDWQVYNNNIHRGAPQTGGENPPILEWQGEKSPIFRRILESFFLASTVQFWRDIVKGIP